MFGFFAKPRPVPAKKAKAAPRKRVAPSGFGSNPGALRMETYAPPSLRAGRPLVVVLHGCGQHARAFAADAGWIAIADQFDLALVLPGQSAANNPGRCFNWFRPGDVKRDAGEAMSIRQMIRSAVKTFGSDPRRIYVAGFSAGGGMAAALLAAYPALFAAGAVVAGMPAGSAATAAGAMLRMRKADTFRSRAALARDAISASGSPPRKRWPRISIWQGERDRTVDPANAEVLATQWTALHGLDALPGTDSQTGGARRRGWGRAGKTSAVELWTLPALAHGFPVAAGLPHGGHPGPWVLEAGLSAAVHIAAFWNLTRLDAPPSPPQNRP